MKGCKLPDGDFMARTTSLTEKNTHKIREKPSLSLTDHKADYNFKQLQQDGSVEWLPVVR